MHVFLSILHILQNLLLSAFENAEGSRGVLVLILKSLSTSESFLYRIYTRICYYYTSDAERYGSPVENRSWISFADLLFLIYNVEEVYEASHDLNSVNSGDTFGIVIHAF